MANAERLNPLSVRLPDQAPDWRDYCRGIVESTPSEHQELINGYGIDWYSTGEVWRNPNRGDKKRVLWLSPHPDDMEFAGGVVMRHFVQKGDEVSELLFTCGSTGRERRGFPDDNTFVTVRLAEAIMGAKEIGIHRVGVITLPNGNGGFDEWLWNGDDVNLRPVWLTLMRKSNPHFIFSPHPDPEIDKHPDHHAVACAVQWMVNWGTEGEFYSSQIPEKADAFEAWYRYATWTGEKTLPITDRFEFGYPSDLAELKKKALGYFVSQYGAGYAQIVSAYNQYHGGMPNVGNNKILSAEVFNVARPTKVISVGWKNRVET